MMELTKAGRACSAADLHNAATCQHNRARCKFQDAWPAQAFISPCLLVDQPGTALMTNSLGVDVHQSQHPPGLQQLPAFLEDLTCDRVGHLMYQV